MNRIRVLQIGKYYHPYIGGTENHLSTLVEGLKKEVNVEVLVSNTQFKTSIERDNGLAVFRLPTLGSFFSVPLSLTMPFWLKRLDAQILHFQLPNPLSVISYFISRPKGKVVISYHSDIVKQRFFAPLFNLFLMRLLKRACYIIVSSDKLIAGSPILKKFKHKCKIIPHGIDIKRFNPTEDILSKAENIKNRYPGPLILFVGRLVYYKGLKFLIAAMKDIQGKLLIVGNGYLKEKLKKLAVRLGVQDKIFWMGNIENEEIVPYYYACDVFVLPSSIKAESFGIVQLEAFACKKPVVSTNLPTGVPFVNLNDKTGLIVPPGNSQALAYAINKLLASLHLREIYGQNGRERVEKEFNKEKMASDVLKIYREVLAEGFVLEQNKQKDIQCELM